MVSMKSTAGRNGGNSCDWEIFEDQILCDLLKVKSTPVLCKEASVLEVSQSLDLCKLSYF